MIFEIEKDGKRYQVDAPDQGAAIRALQNLNQIREPERHPKEPVGFMEDLGKTAIAKPLQGVLDLPGMVGDVDEAASLVGGMFGDLANRALGYPGAEKPPERALKGIAPTSKEWEAHIGFKPYEPEYAVNKALGMGLQLAPGAMLGGGTAAAMKGTGVGWGVGKGAGIGTTGGVGSEFAGQATEGTPFEPYARMAGALVGGGVPAMVRKGVTPMRIHPENKKMAMALKREGVGPLTEGQITQNPARLAKERLVVGDRSLSINQKQGEQFSRAALERIGENADRATSDVMKRAVDRIGNDFNQLSARNTLVPDPNLGTDLSDSVKWYTKRVTPPNHAPIIQSYVQEIRNLVRGGQPIRGEAYQSLRSRLSADARSLTEPYASRTLNDMASDLDEAMERSIAQTNPADVGGFREARRQYRNYLVLEKAMSGQGSDTALGLVSPTALRTATKTVHGQRKYVTGEGEFAELARAGEAMLRPLPMTGYAPALGELNSFAMVGKAMPRALGRLRMTEPIRKYRTNQLMPRKAYKGKTEALAEALMIRAPNVAPLVPPVSEKYYGR